jgi:hypothetical protein
MSGPLIMIVIVIIIMVVQFSKTKQDNQIDHITETEDLDENVEISDIFNILNNYHKMFSENKLEEQDFIKKKSKLIHSLWQKQIHIEQPEIYYKKLSELKNENILTDIEYNELYEIIHT